jgi:hypothetical protein
LALSLGASLLVAGLAISVLTHRQKTAWMLVGLGVLLFVVAAWLFARQRSSHS